MQLYSYINVSCYCCYYCEGTQGTYLFLTRRITWTVAQRLVKERDVRPVTRSPVKEVHSSSAHYVGMSAVCAWSCAWVLTSVAWEWRTEAGTGGHDVGKLGWGLRFQGRERYLERRHLTMQPQHESTARWPGAHPEAPTQHSAGWGRCSAF